MTTFVGKLEAAGVSLYWHAQSIERLLPSGKRNPAAGIMLALLAEVARAEVETIRERINSGLAEARRKGKTLGRPVGSGMDAGALLAKLPAIVKRLKDGRSIRHTARLVNGLTKDGKPKGVSTVQRVEAAMKAA